MSRSTNSGRIELNPKHPFSVVRRTYKNSSVLMRSGNPFTRRRVTHAVDLVQSVPEWSLIIGRNVLATPAQFARSLVKEKESAAVLACCYSNKTSMRRPVDSQSVTIQLDRCS